MTLDESRKPPKPGYEQFIYTDAPCKTALVKHAGLMQKRHAEEHLKVAAEKQAATDKQAGKKRKANEKQKADEKQIIDEKRKANEKHKTAEETTKNYMPPYTSPITFKGVPIRVSRDIVYQQIAALRTKVDVKVWKSAHIAAYYALSYPKLAYASLGISGLGVMGAGLGGIVTGSMLANYTVQQGGGTIDHDLCRLVYLSDIHVWFQKSQRWIGLEMLMRPKFASWYFNTGMKVGVIGMGVGAVGTTVKNIFRRQREMQPPVTQDAHVQQQRPPGRDSRTLLLSERNIKIEKRNQYIKNNPKNITLQIKNINGKNIWNKARTGVPKHYKLSDVEKSHNIKFWANGKNITDKYPNITFGQLISKQYHKILWFGQSNEESPLLQYKNLS